MPTFLQPVPEKKRLSQYFWLFILIHTLIWTLVPALLRHSLPHDTLEGITWGLQWQLGYNKHPFVTAWLCAGISQFIGTVGWPVYLLAQIAVSTTFFAVWCLAKEILQPRQALISALLIDGVLFYNINAYNLTPDTLQSPFWALLSFFFYKAVTTQKYTHWLSTGFFAALCLCVKYQSLLLIGSLFLLCLVNKEARKSFNRWGIYLAFGVFLVCMIPHVYWLYQHHFVTLGYAQSVASNYTYTKTILSHISQPTRFFINALIDVLGVFILAIPFYKTPKSPLNLSTYTWHFLLSISFGPMIITLLLAAITGDYFPPRWATPYFFSIGIVFMVFLHPKGTRTQMKLFLRLLIIWCGLLFIGKTASLTLFPRPESDSFLPNQEIARTINQIWYQHHHTQMAFIAGSNYLVSAITPYLKDNPKPYLNWSQEYSPWIHDEEIREQGGIFLWDEGGHYTWDEGSQKNTQIPAWVLMRFPKLKLLPHYTFYRLSDKHPITIGVAILPPEKP